MADAAAHEAHSGAPRWAITSMLVVSVIAGFLGILTTWVKRQALDTQNWHDTSAKLLAEPKIQEALGTYLADQLFNEVDVANQLQQVLPEQAAALAGPVSGALHELALRGGPELLARPRVQDAWQASNDVAHKQLLRVIDDKGKFVSTGSGDVTLNLHALVDQLAGTLGLEEELATARSKL